MLPKAILLDLDDTIISFRGSSDIAWKETCIEYGGKLCSYISADDLANSIDATRDWFWGDPERHRIGRLDMDASRRKIVRIALRKLGYRDKAKALEIADYFNERQEKHMMLFPDSIKALEKIKAAGIRMILVSNGNSDKQRGKIDRFGIEKYFEQCLIEGEVGYGKPDIRIFKLALSILELKAEDVWMVGDNLVWDVEAPQKVGIYSIWNDYKKTGLPINSKIVPDRIINSIIELI